MEEISKKNELINIARSLFYTKGFNNTSIQNIIDSANIAKGTFYHYFKSKDDILNQLTEIDIEAAYVTLYNILNLDIDAISKLNKTFQIGANWKNENIELMRVLTKTMLSDSNLLLRHTMIKTSTQKLMPLYESIISQGVKEGTFCVRDPRYSAKFILSSFSQNIEDMQKILFSDKFTTRLLEEFKELLLNFENSIEKILGAKEGTVHIIDDIVLEKLLKGLLEA